MNDETAQPGALPIRTALESAAASMRALRQPRTDADLFTDVTNHGSVEAVVLRDLQHTTAATRAQTELLKLAHRTPYMQTDKGRAFMAKVAAIVGNLETLP